MVLTGKHLNIADAELAQMKQQHVPDSGRDIHIGSGCFIGAGAIIIGPARIGNNAIVGAGAVVTKDVPDRAMVGGVPAKVIRLF